MQRPNAALTLILLLATQFVGCARVPTFPGAYKIDVQQGNIITRDMVDKLHTGMTRSQVLFVMGAPLLPNTYDRDRWDYVYTLKPGGDPLVRKALSVFFADDKLVRLEGRHLARQQQRERYAPTRPVS